MDGQEQQVDSQIVQVQDAARLYAGQFAELYNVHRQNFMLQNPQPILRDYAEIVPMPTRPIIQDESKLPRMLLLALIVSALIVAGSRTVSEFGAILRGDPLVMGFVGVAGFVMVNVAVIVYAFIRTSTNYNEERHTSVQKLINGGMWVAFTVDIVANVHAALKAIAAGGAVVDQHLATVLSVIDVVFTVGLAVSAPILAFIAGDAFGLYVVRDRSRQMKADAQYQDSIHVWNDERKEHEREYESRVQEWRDRLNEAWNAEKGRMGLSVRVIERPKLTAGRTDGQGRALSDRTDNGQTNGRVLSAAYGHSRTADGQTRVIEYLNVNPQDADLPARKLAEKMLTDAHVKVGHDTANKGRNAWRDMQVNGTQGE